MSCFPFSSWWYSTFCWCPQTLQRTFSNKTEGRCRELTAAQSRPQDWHGWGVRCCLFSPLPRCTTLYLLIQRLSCHLFTCLPYLVDSFWQWDFITISTIWLLERANIINRIGDFTVHYLSRSRMKALNKISPSITSHGSFFQHKKQSLSPTCCLLFFSYLPTYRSSFPPILWQLSLLFF